MMGSEIERSEAMDGFLLMQSNAYQLPEQRFHQAISRMYGLALLRGWLYRVIARILQHEGRLIDYEGALKNGNIRSSHDSGIRTVPIDRIRGSLGRTEDFDAAFRPLKAHTRARWLSVASAWVYEVALPPVELVQVGELYFVRDGHHRLSVAKAFGQESIEATVIVVDVAEG
jgi:uncharacterized ParB-like nuclease family protein